MVGGAAAEDDLTVLLGNNIVVLKVVGYAKSLYVVENGDGRVSALQEVGVQTVELFLVRHTAGGGRQCLAYHLSTIYAYSHSEFLGKLGMLVIKHQLVPYLSRP